MMADDTSPKPIDCFYAKNHALIWSDGSISPCCVYRSNEDPIGDYTDVFEFFNSPEMAQLRQDHANGIKRPGCRKCWSVEDAGGGSYRGSMPSNPEHAGQLKGLDVAVGRTCTLKCLTCGPHASSAWESELASRGLAQSRMTLDIGDIPVQAYDHIEKLDIQGGEPFLSKKLPNILGYLVAKGLSKKIFLTIVTNVETFPDQRYTEPLKHFGKLLIKLSLDAVGPRNEYIRSGSRWENTMESFERWGKFKRDNPNSNIELVISHTVSTFNFIYYDEMVAEVARLRTLPGLEELQLWAHHALEKTWHNCFLLPHPLREDVAKIWRRDVSVMYEHRGFRRTMANMLVAENQLPPMPFDQWWQDIIEMDRLRGQDIGTALPELVDLFRKYDLLPHPSII